MAKMYVSFLLNFFQPASQSQDVFNQISEECYLPLSELFNSSLNPRFSITFYIGLFNFFNKSPYGQDIMKKIREAKQKKAVEILHSGAYYSILPLMTREESQWQIKSDIDIKKEELELYERSGFFFPELCYNDSLVPLLQDFNFKWTIIDDQLFQYYNIPNYNNKIYQIKGFCIFLRSSFWSNKIVNQVNWRGQTFINSLSAEIEQEQEDRYLIIALAAETFGHHIKYYDETFLRDMLYAIDATENVELIKISDLIDKNLFEFVEKKRETSGEFDYFPSSSWATDVDNIKRGDPFPHWKSTGNPIHTKQWELTILLLEACRNCDWQVETFKEIRSLLNEAFYSCQYFSASIWYREPASIYKGLDRQMRVLYKLTQITGDTEILRKGQSLYLDIIQETL